MPKLVHYVTKWERHGKGSSGKHSRRTNAGGHYTDTSLAGICQEIDRKFRAWKQRRGIVEDVDEFGYGKSFVYGNGSIGESN